MAISKEVVRYGPFKDYIAEGVKVGDTLYISGQVSIDDAGNVVGAGDLIAQTRQACAQVRTVLEKYGATMANVVDETVFVTDVANAVAQLDPLFAARAEAFGGSPDVTQTFVQAAALFMPGLLIEIKCIARL